ncbi:MAG: hypothetical protein L0H36_03700 [bacterium]|nr:hypothetical protein [bacterium]MDN5835714.1 hypothetical protein [bacterium]
MLTYFVKRSQGEDFQEMKRPPEANVWVQGTNISGSDLESLHDNYSFDKNILHDALDSGELPRIEKKDGAMYVFVRTIHRGKHGVISTTPVLLAVKNSVFIGISTASAIDYNTAASRKLVQMTDATSLLLGTFAGIVGEYEALMQRTARYINDTTHRLRNHEVTNQDFVKFVTVENNIGEYRMNLSGMMAVTDRLKEVVTTHEETEAVEDIRLYIKQLLVSTESYQQSVTSIRNSYGIIADNTLNRRIKALTVLTLLVTLPNVFYGMYGMNVSLPFQNEPWAYAGIVIFTITVVLLVYLIAKRFRIF